MELGERIRERLDGYAPGEHDDGVRYQLTRGLIRRLATRDDWRPIRAMAAAAGLTLSETFTMSDVFADFADEVTLAGRIFDDGRAAEFAECADLDDFTYPAGFDDVDKIATRGFVRAWLVDADDLDEELRKEQEDAKKAAEQARSDFMSKYSLMSAAAMFERMAGDGFDAAEAVLLPMREDLREMLDVQIKGPQCRESGVARGGYALRHGQILEIVGAAKTGKSAAALQMCLSMLQGGTWLFWRANARNILYIDCEMGQMPVAERVMKATATRPDLFPSVNFHEIEIGEGDERRTIVTAAVDDVRDTLSRLSVVSLRDCTPDMVIDEMGEERPAPVGVDYIVNLCKQFGEFFGGLDLVVIDPIYKIMAGDLNDVMAWSELDNKLRSAGVEGNPAWCIVHHTRKDGTDSSGSWAFEGITDLEVKILKTELHPSAGKGGGLENYYYGPDNQGTRHDILAYLATRRDLMASAYTLDLEERPSLGQHGAFMTAVRSFISGGSWSSYVTPGKQVERMRVFADSILSLAPVPDTHCGSVAAWMLKDDIGGIVEHTENGINLEGVVGLDFEIITRHLEEPPRKHIKGYRVGGSVAPSFDPLSQHVPFYEREAERKTNAEQLRETMRAYLGEAAGPYEPAITEIAAKTVELYNEAKSRGVVPVWDKIDTVGESLGTDGATVSMIVGRHREHRVVQVRTGEVSLYSEAKITLDAIHLLNEYGAPLTSKNVKRKAVELKNKFDTRYIDGLVANDYSSIFGIIDEPKTEQVDADVFAAQATKNVQARAMERALSEPVGVVDDGR